MDLMNRKAFMTAGLAAAAGAAAAACGMGGDGDDAAIIVHIQGVLANPPMPNGRIDFVVSGRPSALSGQGYSFLLATDVPNQIGSASMWSVQGSLAKDALKLRGLTLLANNQALPGALITVEVDMKTGDCAWSMGPFLNGDPTFASKGQVFIAMGNARMSGASAGGVEGSGTPRPSAGGGM